MKALFSALGLILLPACGNGGSHGGVPATGGIGSAVVGTTIGGGGDGAVTTGGSHSGGSTASASTQQAGTSSAGGTTSGAGAPSTVVPGQPCSVVCASGQISLCLGAGCPYEECGAPWDDHPCSYFYSTPADSNTVYCAANETNAYCLVTESTQEVNWAVNCVNGTPTITACTSGCQASNPSICM